MNKRIKSPNSERPSSYGLVKVPGKFDSDGISDVNDMTLLVRVKMRRLRLALLRNPHAKLHFPSLLSNDWEGNEHVVKEISLYIRIKNTTGKFLLLAQCLFHAHHFLRLKKTQPNASDYHLYRFSLAVRDLDLLANEQSIATGSKILSAAKDGGEKRKNDAANRIRYLANILSRDFCNYINKRLINNRSTSNRAIAIRFKKEIEAAISGFDAEARLPRSIGRLAVIVGEVKATDTFKRVQSIGSEPDSKSCF